MLIWFCVNMPKLFSTILFPFSWCPRNRPPSPVVYVRILLKFQLAMYQRLQTVIVIPGVASIWSSQPVEDPYNGGSTRWSQTAKCCAVSRVECGFVLYGLNCSGHRNIRFMHLGAIQIHSSSLFVRQTQRLENIKPVSQRTDAFGCFSSEAVSLWDWRLRSPARSIICAGWL